MEHQKIANLLNESNYSQFVTIKWNIAMISQNQIMVQEMKLFII